MARVTAPAQQPPSTPRQDLGKKTHAHVRYYTSTGEQVPGVTTILGVLNKPALVPWANKLGLQGIDTSKYTDEAAAIGTLAHAIVAEQLGGEPAPLADYSPAQLERATHSLEAFVTWRVQHTLEPRLVEEQLVSDEHRFGGTIDCLCLLDGQLTLVDVKTSSGIWPEHKYQLSGYWKLLDEHGHKIKGARILRIGRTEGEGMEEHVLTGAQILHGWRVFEHCLAIYRLQRKK